MQSLEGGCNEGERAVKRLKAVRAASLPLAMPKEECQASTSDFDDSKPTRFDIFDELQKLQDEDDTDSSCDEEEQGVQYRSLILEKLVKREKLHTIILNLFPDNKGYSLVIGARDKSTMGVKETSEKVIQTKGRGYKEEVLFRYLANEELPPFILEALDRYDFIFYNGCVICEVRNYRQAQPENKCHIHHVLLRPTQRTILAEFNHLTKNRSEFTSEERDAIESQIVMAHTPQLCLDPDPDLEDRMTTIYNRSRVWNEHPFMKMARRATQAAANRKRKLEQFTHRHGLELLEFCRAKNAKISKPTSTKETKTVIPELAPPTQPVATNKFTSMPWPDWSEDKQDCSLHLLEEYTLETDINTSQDRDRPGLLHMIKLSIFQRPHNMEFVGELYLERNYARGQRNGVSCRFPLGATRTGVHNYVCQFNDIFTECGRKNYRMTNSLVSIGRDVIPSADPPNVNTVRFMQNLQYEEVHPMVHLRRLNLALQAQNQRPQPVLNGVLQGIRPVQIQAHVQVPNVQVSNIQVSNLQTAQQLARELEVDALATSLEISSQQAMEKAKRQQAAVLAAQQHKLLPNSNIISLLNSRQASNANSDTSAAVANAINSGVMPQQRMVSRKMMLSNIAGARVLSHGNFIALNNHNRVNLQELNAQRGNAAGGPQTVTLSTAPVNNTTRVNLGALNVTPGQPQTVTLTSVNSGGGSGGNYTYTAMPVKQQVMHQRIIATSQNQDANNEGALGELLAGTAAANRPEIANQTNQANSLLLEKLAASSGQNPFAQSPKTPQQQQATAQFIVQSPKANTVLSPMSSPPPQATNTLNVQSLNLTQLQSISGLQFQVQNFSQPISLSLNSATATPQGVVMSLPGAQGQQGATQTVVMNATGSTAGPSQLAHLVSTGAVKSITHHNIRTAAGSQTLQLAPGSSQFQLISQLQRQNRQQNLQGQAAITARTLQRPITIKMAPNSNQQTMYAEPVQHYQQLCISQQKGLEGVYDKLRRSSNEQP